PPATPTLSLHRRSSDLANNKGVLLGGQRRLKKGNEHIHHHLGVSGFAEYAVINQHSLIKVDPSIPFHEVALFGCAVITGVGAVLDRKSTRLNSSHVKIS